MHPDDYKKFKKVPTPGDHIPLHLNPPIAQRVNGILRG
jgi:hypothetical protein